MHAKAQNSVLVYTVQLREMITKIYTWRY